MGTVFFGSSHVSPQPRAPPADFCSRFMALGKPLHSYYNMGLLTACLSPSTTYLELHSQWACPSPNPGYAMISSGVLSATVEWLGFCNAMDFHCIEGLVSPSLWVSQFLEKHAGMKEAVVGVCVYTVWEGDSIPTSTWEEGFWMLPLETGEFCHSLSLTWHFQLREFVPNLFHRGACPVCLGSATPWTQALLPSLIAATNGKRGPVGWVDPLLAFEPKPEALPCYHSVVGPS